NLASLMLEVKLMIIQSSIMEQIASELGRLWVLHSELQRLSRLFVDVVIGDFIYKLQFRSDDNGSSKQNFGSLTLEQYKQHVGVTLGRKTQVGRCVDLNMADVGILSPEVLALAAVAATSMKDSFYSKYGWSFSNRIQC
ncbi:hypothetical protein ACJX0J_033972, partial [Zea mays]